ncbi:armadillo-type protein, partial [Boletus edulis BED1]
LLHSASSATYGPSSGSALLPQFVPQLSGDSGFFKRFSAFPTWSSTTSPPSLSVNTKGRSSGEFATGPRFSASSDKAEDAKPVHPQATGSIFSTWWAALGGETATGNEHSTSARAYVDGIHRSWIADTKLANTLSRCGIIAISGLLSSLVGKGGKRKALTDSENSVLLEVIRSLRVLLNTESGFDAVLLSPTIVTHIAYSLHGSSLKIRTLAAELLAGTCMVSFDEGHRAVLAALSEYRIAYNELFRFQSFVSALKIPDSDVDSVIPGVTFSTEEEGIWEARTAFMALVNALTNCPHTLEERIVLRDEFSRRGLNEAVAALRYIKPPDSLLKQLDMYTEEKYDDEEDFRERARRAVRDSRIRSTEAPEPSILLEEIMQTARLLEAGDAVESILRRLNAILQGVSDPSFKGGILSVMDEFVGGIATMENSDQAWTTYLQTLAASVQRLCGRKLPVGNTKVLEEEAQGLRKQLVDLTRETGSGHLHRQEGSAVYAGDNPSPASARAPASSPKKGSPGPKPGNEMINGLMQRLTQKEKEVTQLKGEIDRLKIQNSGDSNDPDDRARKQRDKANLNALSEEVVTLKEKIGEIDNALSNKDKEIAHMKRAFES